MAESNKGLIFGIIGVVVVLLLFAGQKSDTFKQIDGPAFEIGTSPASSSLTFRMFDKNGDLIGITDTLSIVAGTPGVTEIDVSIKLTNTGNQVLSCSIASSGNTCTPISCPSEFTTANKLSGAGVVNLPISVSSGWTSQRMQVAQWEGKTVTFNAGVTCTFTPPGGSEQTVGPKSATPLVLAVSAEGSVTGDFTVNLQQGSIETLYCGDGLCSSSVGETSSSCPADCTSGQPIFNFRTTDLAYTSGSSIGLTASDGATCTTSATMSEYDRGTPSSTNIIGGSGDDCASGGTHMPINPICGSSGNSFLFALPSGHGIFAAGKTILSSALWKSGTASGRYCVCTSFNDGTYGTAPYNLDATPDNVNLILDTTTNTGKERSCGIS